MEINKQFYDIKFFWKGSCNLQTQLKVVTNITDASREEPEWVLDEEYWCVMCCMHPITGSGMKCGSVLLFSISDTQKEIINP